MTLVAQSSSGSAKQYDATEVAASELQLDRQLSARESAAPLRRPLGSVAWR